MGLLDSGTPSEPSFTAGRVRGKKHTEREREKQREKKVCAPSWSKGRGGLSRCGQEAGWRTMYLGHYPHKPRCNPRGGRETPHYYSRFFFLPSPEYVVFFFSFLSFSRSPLFPPCSGLGEGGEDHDGKRKRRKKKMTSPHYTTPDHCPPTLTTSLFLFSSLFLVPLLPRSCTQT